MTKIKIKPHGFTLAELLIALVILGLIATFTIPKVLTSQQSSQFNSVAKETVGMISGAYQAYQNNNTVDASTGPASLTPYMNYVRVVTNSTLDDFTGGTALACNATWVCLDLHNGARMMLGQHSLGGTAVTNGIYFYVDPDGKTDGTATGPGKSVAFLLYANGRIVSWNNCLPNSTDSGGNMGLTCPNTKDPAWFSWN